VARSGLFPKFSTRRAAARANTGVRAALADASGAAVASRARRRLSMDRVSMMCVCSALALGCATGQQEPRPRSAGDLQAEYETKQQAFDQCLQDFADCASAAADPSAIGACADDLQTCLDGGLGGTGSESGSESGSGSGSSTSDDGGGSESGTSDGGAPEPGGACEDILDGCLADPFALDPTCLDAYEQCVHDEIDADLSDLCDELEAECESFAPPAFDCSSICP
jgi:hypothetical protein